MEDPTQLTKKGSLKGRDDVSFDSGTLICVNELYYMCDTVNCFKKSEVLFFLTHQLGKCVGKHTSYRTTRIDINPWIIIVIDYNPVIDYYNPVIDYYNSVID